MRSKILIQCILFAFLSFIVVSCSSELEETVVPDIRKSLLDVHKEVLSSMGYDVSDIEEFDYYYLVEGDLRFDKNKLPTNANTLSLRHYVAKIIASGNRVYTVGVSSEVDSRWVEAVKEAVKEWSNIEVCKLKFQYVGVNSNADIIFDSYEFEAGSAGYTYLPDVYSEPYKYIYLNSKLNATYDVLQKKFVAIHELGHTLGLGHTNRQESGSSYMKGTAVSDPNSVFNSNTATTRWSGFSYYDIHTIQMIWPKIPTIISRSAPSGRPDYYSDSRPTFTSDAISSAYSNYEWEVRGSISTTQNGNLVYATPYEGCTYLAVDLTVTTRYGAKIKTTKGFSKYTFN